MGHGRPLGVRVTILAAMFLALTGRARADWPRRWVDVGIGPYRDPRYTNTQGNIPGTPRDLAPGYGYYPYYSYNWPSLREALALKRAGLTPADLPHGPGPWVPSPPVVLSGEATPAAPAVLHVLVPADAEVWVGASPTAQRGPERRFVSPPLEGGRNLSYEIRARWKEQGRDVERTRTVRVYPGDRLTVDFLTPEAGGETLPAPRPLRGP
jgi:uncharacterized protein (TIGR03000 family)